MLFVLLRRSYYSFGTRVKLVAKKNRKKRLEEFDSL